MPIIGVGPGGQPNDFKAGPDGNLWFTDPDNTAIGRFTLDGTVTEYPLPPDSNENIHRPYFITTGPDGNLWFTGHGEFDCSIGRITL